MYEQLTLLRPDKVSAMHVGEQLNAALDCFLVEGYKTNCVYCVRSVRGGNCMISIRIPAKRYGETPSGEHHWHFEKVCHLWSVTLNFVSDFLARSKGLQNVLTQVQLLSGQFSEEFYCIMCWEHVFKAGLWGERRSMGNDSKTVFSPSTRVIPKLFTNNAPMKQEERGWQRLGRTKNLLVWEKITPLGGREGTRFRQWWAQGNEIWAGGKWRVQIA